MMRFDRTPPRRDSRDSSSRPMRHVPLNAPVLTSDGYQLGRVRAVRGRYFQVDAPARWDYWLALAGVRALTTAGVRLHFPKDQVGGQKFKKPLAR
jgi:hypothetical protein